MRENYFRRCITNVNNKVFTLKLTSNTLCGKYTYKYVYMMQMQIKTFVLICIVLGKKI